MQIVIDISKETYDDIQSMDWKNNIWADDIWRAIHNGTPLPKGHGRLIDADELRCENVDFDAYYDYCLMFDEIDTAPTIIEADKEESI